MPHESEEEVSLLKHLLRKEGQETFDAMANELWHSDSSDDATARLQRLAEELLGGEKGELSGSDCKVRELAAAAVAE